MLQAAQVWLGCSAAVSLPGRLVAEWQLLKVSMPAWQTGCVAVEFDAKTVLVFWRQSCNMALGVMQVLQGLCVSNACESRRRLC